MGELKNGWYVLYTRPRHEKKVVACLDTMALEYFLPTIKTLRMVSRRKKQVTLPLFPSYVFVRPENARMYVESLRVPGVIQYVKSGKDIAQINESVIEKLKTIHNCDNPDLLISDQEFTPGQVLTISAGPFAGFSCEVIQHHGRHKILVRVSLLQRSILVDIPEGYLVPAC